MLNLFIGEFVLLLYDIYIHIHLYIDYVCGNIAVSVEKWKKL